MRTAADQLSYVPNSLGRGLRAQRLGAIALVVPERGGAVFPHPYYMELIEGISEITTARDMVLILSTAANSEGDSAYLRLLRARRADGVIVAAASVGDRNVHRLLSSGYPVVLLGRLPHEPDIWAVGVDDEGGAQEATRHLIDVHHARRVAHIALPFSGQAGIDRLEGYRRALGRSGIPFDERLVAEGDATQRFGARAALELAGRNDVDAIFIANDEMAIGALNALRASEMTVPDRVAVIGFDDISFAQAVYPPLTTVRQPMLASGRLAADRLLGILDGTAREPRQVILPTHLVVRESCGCRPLPSAE